MIREHFSDNKKIREVTSQLFHHIDPMDSHNESDKKNIDLIEYKEEKDSKQQQFNLLVMRN